MYEPLHTTASGNVKKNTIKMKLTSMYIVYDCEYDIRVLWLVCLTCVLFMKQLKCHSEWYLFNFSKRVFLCEVERWRAFVVNHKLIAAMLKLILINYRWYI